MTDIFSLSMEINELRLRLQELELDIIRQRQKTDAHAEEIRTLRRRLDLSRPVLIPTDGAHAACDEEGAQ